MLKEESIWIANQLEKRNLMEGMKVLNVGSSSYHFRTKEQPYIHNIIFQPLYDKGVGVIHSDMKDEEGVDLVGDLTDNKFIEKLKEEKIDVVICSNLLEHLSNRSILIDALSQILQQGGVLIITVPYRFPLHKDPIDTMYRPRVDQLKELFLGMDMLSGQEVKEPGTSHFRSIRVNYKVFLFEIAKTLVPYVFAGKDWPSLFKYLPHWGKNYSTTCIILRKK